MTSKPFSYAVLFRGRWACPCQAQWIPVYEAELQRRGLLRGPITIYQLIGGAAASGGTHTHGGASDFLDLPGDHDEAVWVARQMGADATWHRPPNWDGAGGIEHDHCVLRGCPHNGPAAYQITAVDDGYDGLGHLGRGAHDTGPRPLSGRTWQQGIEWAHDQEDDMQDADWQKFQTMLDTQRQKIVADVVHAVWATTVDRAKTTAKAALRKAAGLQ